MGFFSVNEPIFAKRIKATTRVIATVETLDLTADHWELFSSEDPEGAEAAAKKINAAIVTACNAGLDRRAVWKAAETVMQEYSSFGACDSEGYQMLDEILDHLFGSEHR